jgi:hypothetical protein
MPTASEVTISTEMAKEGKKRGKQKKTGIFVGMEAREETRTSAGVGNIPNVEPVTRREEVAAVVRRFVVHLPATALAALVLRPLDSAVGRPSRDVSGRGPVQVSQDRAQGRAGIVGLDAGQGRAVGNGGQAGGGKDKDVGEHLEAWRVVISENELSGLLETGLDGVMMGMMIFRVETMGHWWFKYQFDELDRTFLEYEFPMCRIPTVTGTG